MKTYVEIDKIKNKIVQSVYYDLWETVIVFSDSTYCRVVMEDGYEGPEVVKEMFPIPDSPFRVEAAARRDLLEENEAPELLGKIAQYERQEQDKREAEERALYEKLKAKFEY